MSGPLSLSILSMLPTMTHSKPLRLEAGDVLIHAPGFEDRTMAVVADTTAEKGAAALLLDYEPANANNRLSDVRDALRLLGVQCEADDVLKYNRFHPGNFEDRLTARLKALRAAKAIVDVSTMSKLAIMLVLNACKNLDLETDVVYSEAEYYGPSEDEYYAARNAGKIHQPSLHVFNGIHGVVRVDSLASVAMQGQPTAAIVFMSFNDALTQLLLNTVYPGRLFLINGTPPVHGWRERATAWVHEQVRLEWKEDNPVQLTDAELPLRSASTLDYRESVGILLDLYWKLSTNHRVLLAPSGSKMQTVACYLVKALHSDIHIEYPSPDGFAKEYSSGVGTRWLIPFGKFGDRLAAIEQVERENFLEIAI